MGDIHGGLTHATASASPAKRLPQPTNHLRYTVQNSTHLRPSPTHLQLWLLYRRFILKTISFELYGQKSKIAR
jgi:hypothetical protein